MSRASAILLVLVGALLADQCFYALFIDRDDRDNKITNPDYKEHPNELYLIQNVFVADCIPLGGNCDHRLSDCCPSSGCRCNFWGYNCHCQPMSLFWKLG